MATGTNNPPGSDDPLDIRANAKNLDLLLLGPNSSYPSRLGVEKRSWEGINSAYDAAEDERNIQFQQFLEASGFEYPPLAYVDGVPLQVDRSAQTIERSGNIYTVKVPNTFPFFLTGTFATDEPNLVLRNDQTLRQDLAAPDGSNIVTHTPDFAGGFTRAVKGKLSDTITSADVGAIGDGNLYPVSDWYTVGAAHYRGYANLAAVQADYPHVTSGTQQIDWAALQLGFSGKQRFDILDGTYRIDGSTLQYSAEIDFSGRGKQVFGCGRRRTLIQNLTTSHPLVNFGDAVANFDGLDCGLFDLSLQGNILSTGGIQLLGDDDDGLTQASRGVCIDGVRISDVGAGAALRVSAWVVNVGYLETQNNLRGVQIGNHVYSATFTRFYNVSAANEAIYIDPSVLSSKATQIVFLNPVLQACGATGQAVLLGGAAGVSIINPYIENLNANATAVFRAGAGNRSSRVQDVFYTRGSGPDTLDIVDTASPSFVIDGIDGRGDVRSFVKITGASIGTRIYNLEQPTGARSVGWIDDQSTGKRTTYLNPKDTSESRLTPMAFFASTTEAAIKWCNRTNGAIQGFIQNGRVYLGTDDTTANLQAAGTTISLLSGSSGVYATARSEALRMGPTNCKVIYRTAGTPEGAEAADPGSICMVQTGASLGLWGKNTGTGNTGWTLK